VFYNKVKCVLWLATLILAIPLFLRALNWFVIIEDKKYEVYYDNNISYANAIYLILTTIVPVCA